MHYWIFGVIALIFFVVAYFVGIEKKLYLISTVDKKDLRKISNKEIVSKRFGAYYFFLGLISLFSAYLTEQYGSLGLGIGTVLLMFLFLISIVYALKLYWYK